MDRAAQPFERLDEERLDIVRLEPPRLGAFYVFADARDPAGIHRVVRQGSHLHEVLKPRPVHGSGNRQIQPLANLWVANYYSARNPLRLSSLVILGVVARMFRCATRSSCWCT